MTGPVTERTAAAIAARRRATAHKLDEVRAALNRLHRDRARITFPAVARHAGVSRTFLYENPDARSMIELAIGRTDHPRVASGDQDTAQEAHWRERALNSEDALKQAHAEIHAQRFRISQFLGRIRELEHEYPQDSVARITTENTTLKQRLRQAEADTRTLKERLEAARSNLRFQDRRLASLEAELLEAGHKPR